MKSQVILTAALLCSAVSVRADVEVTMPELHRIGFLPEDKADLHPEEKLDMKRRNPFAERKKKTVANKPTDTVETEESRLRMFFDPAKRKITGIMDIGGKRTVTLDRLTLEAGQTIPPVIAGQTQILRVMRVEKDLLEIGWVEEGGYDSAVPRKITLKIDFTPKVKSLLASEDHYSENPQVVYLTDDKGKVALTPRGLFPNPSAIVEDLPPGSDTNPLSQLTADEEAQKNAAQGAASLAPSVPEIGPDSAPSDVPPSTEDGVQPDPDMVNPQPAESAAAGAPVRPSR